MCGAEMHTHRSVSRVDRGRIKPRPTHPRFERSNLKTRGPLPVRDARDAATMPVSVTLDTRGAEHFEPNRGTVRFPGRASVLLCVRCAINIKRDAQLGARR